ncbi:MAG: cytochrome c nitrite reductase small subunit [Deinococcales bacterium]
MKLTFSAVVAWLAGSGFLTALALGFGILGGAGGYTAYYAKATSYLSNDPQACVNCHIMRDVYDSWQKSPHHAVAVCNDCHLPHDFFGKWLAKAENGFNHSKAFTLQNFHEPIRVHEKNLEILEHNCQTCHANTTHQMTAEVKQDKSFGCLHCHANVAHGASR